MRFLSSLYVHTLYTTLLHAYENIGEGSTFHPILSEELIFEHLDGAVGRPRQGYGGFSTFPTFFEKVASLGHAIVQNHVFGNGNKRTAFLSMTHFMMLNGWYTYIPPEIVALMMLRTAGSKTCGESEKMTVKEISDIIGAYSHCASSVRSVFAIKKSSKVLIESELLIIDGKDVIPAPHPDEPKQNYIDRANEIISRHHSKMSAEDTELYRSTFSWPTDLEKNLTWFLHDKFKKPKKKKRK